MAPVYRKKPLPRIRVHAKDFGCPATITNNAFWLPVDFSNFHVASKRCKVKFKNSPCLIKFTKTKERSYRAICGARR